MTGGIAVILGNVGDNFAAGMTGGMSFVYDTDQKLEKKINPETVIFQKVETDYWKNFLKNLIVKHLKETDSIISKKILDNFEKEINDFYQVCPKEMLGKLEYPITQRSIIKDVS